MLNFTRNDRLGSAKSADKSALKPAVTAAAAAPAAPGSTPARTDTPAAPAAGDRAIPTLSNDIAATAPPAAATPAAPPSGPEIAGSKLFVGPDIKLKGVEISDCDVLVVEGHVEATVHSKAMQVAKPGTFQGVAEIDVAEIDGTFTGELTAHTKLVIHGTGKVSGTIRYGRLIVADGGQLTGDVKRIDPALPERVTARTLMPDGRPLLSPEPTPPA
jgi:cytoskeletal protein CcmA (bactofilin family)